ncbi:MAG: right-handed parallel beta-helix repeat-containing protein [bacterium]|nr:right-handed parallel beta-helix repeat-containing protein [bacterium]
MTRIQQTPLRSVLIVILLSVTATGFATDWHVAPGGIDGASGTPANPLATLAHAVSRASSGDHILLLRGGTYHALDVNVGNDLAIGAYGEGDLPILTASVEVSLPGTWPQNTAVRTGPVSERVVTCYVDGRFVPLARYPNKDVGFLRVDNDDEWDRIVDSDLAMRPGVTPGRWTGAQVRWRRWSWWWETRPVANHSAVDTLELSGDGRVDILISDPGSGYFIDNDLDELDAPGEWHWRDGVLYLYPPVWADPSSMEVQVVTTSSADPLVDHETEPTGLVSTGTAFDSVHFSRFYGIALKLNGPATVENCTFSEIESTALNYTWNSQPFAVQRSVFRDVRNIAIKGWADATAPAGSLIERNLFLRIGSEPGYGGNGPWHAAGVIIGQANAAVVRLNRFVDTGYAGIILGSDGQTVERNVFVRSMGTLNDGAAIYTNCNASVIRENIILDTIGNLEFSHPWWPMGHGIWPEFLEEFRDTQIVNNTLYGNNGHGIFLPNNYHCTISGNVILDSRRAGLGLYRFNDDPGFDPNQDHTIVNNKLASVAPTRRIVRPENLSHWWLPPYTEPVPVALEYETTVDYGIMSHTTFIAPSSDAGVIRVEPYPNGSSYEIDSLAAWMADAPWADSTGSLIARAHAFLLFNDTETASNMVVPEGVWTLPDGTPVGETVFVQPFRSTVLISASAPPSTPPYSTASGIDWRSETPVSTYLGNDAAIFSDGFETGTTIRWSISVKRLLTGN